MTNNDILLMADVVSREKSLAKEVIFQAIEAALAMATRKRHLKDIDARVSINRDTGDFDTFRVWEVIENDAELEFPDRQIRLDEALKIDDSIEFGGTIEEPLEAVAFGRIAAQAAKQVIMQKVREAEREKIVEDYDGRKGEMLNGVVKHVDRGDATIDLGGAEAVLPKSYMIPREGLRPGDRIRAILKEVRPAQRGPQLFLDRVCPELLIELFNLEVPEAGDGLIEILSAARDPGLRAKIAVNTSEPKIDPVGACVGIRGSRVQSVSNEIGGERVDIIRWSSDPATFVMNALAPAEAQSIVVDEETQSMDVIVAESQLSQAIGRGGQNVRLASELTGWVLNIMTDQSASEKAETELTDLRDKIMKELDVDEDVATILVQEGFTSLEEVAYVPKQELIDIEEFDEDLVDELRSRAEDGLLTRAIAQAETIQDAQPEQDLREMEGMDEELAKLLASNGIRNMEALAECSVDELLEIPDFEEEVAKKIIMTARAPWFANEGEESKP